jgi:hypothetical protein
MKVALCFIISYEHILNKEEIWKEWIEPNKDIINVYFYYKDFNKISSEWIRNHCIPPSFIYETSYYYVIPAYLSIMSFAMSHDNENQWFCLLTDSCCPIISPKRFRYLFYKNYDKSIISWKKAWWNIQFHKRANLALLPEELRLANEPWFVMKRENIQQILHFSDRNSKLLQLISSGGLANESLFAIIMYIYKQLNTFNVICQVTHMTDWNRRSSTTSPHLFKETNELDITFINESLEKNNYVMFIRKIASEYPDEILKYYIYDYGIHKDNKISVVEPGIFFVLRMKKQFKKFLYYGLPFMFFIYLWYYLLY